jgi:3'-phosphoadenosine 5'-phosphosulfate sulfotransferase (PAPS reductase)/FAD synthetase
MKTCNLISISGGKDSTATLLKAIEDGVENLKAVFADTGHEHELTYKYIDYLQEKTGIEIVRVKPDFTKQIERKREVVKTKWRKEFIDGKSGYWCLNEDRQAVMVNEKIEFLYLTKPQLKEKIDYIRAEQGECSPKYTINDLGMPENYFSYPFPNYSPANKLVSHVNGCYDWIPEISPISEQEADNRVAKILENLKPTGNPFLDMCIWKGRFPSSQARFCTEELKKKPLIDYQEQLMSEFDRINVWVGVRRDESIARSKITEEWELEFGDCVTGEGMWLYRPILNWTVDDVFSMHKKYGIEPNPLYKMGMGRVGCMPCVMCRKGELKVISERCSEEIDRLEQWEHLVAKTSKRGKSTFFNVSQIHGIHDNDKISTEEHGIRSAVEWAKTSRGGRQFNLLGDLELEQKSACTSIYGLCE